MADLNPMVPGDVPYPQYSVTTTEEINTGVTIVKGVVYTKSVSGKLVISTGDFINGIFQAKATPEVVPAVAGDKVQVLGPRTRMILIDSAGGLSTGRDVVNLTNTDEVIGGLKTDTNYIGKIFEIYTRNADSSKKTTTIVGDRVIVETVQA